MNAATLGYLSVNNQLDILLASVSCTPSNPGSSWIANGGTTPTLSGRVCNNATAGALPLPLVSPSLGSAGFQLVKYKMSIPAGACNAVVYDRLVDYGGAVANTTSAQNFSAQSLTRYTSGLGNQLILEVYSTSTGSSATSCTISYTNELGNSGRSATLNLPASWCSIPRIYNFSLQSGDLGVRSIQSVTLGTTSTNAGDFGINIVYPIATLATGLSIANGVGGFGFRDITRIISNPVLSNACLFFSFQCSGSVTGSVALSYSLV
jgi:hypothetical protein